MRRREFIALGSAVVACPLAAGAQHAARIPHIGFLGINRRRPFSPGAPRLLEVFLARLHELGYEEGRNIVIEYRDPNGEYDRLPGLAAELARLELDLIFPSSSLGLRAVRQATSTIPIVSPVMMDPVGDGYAISLARPGGNVTGLTVIGPGLAAKRLELLKELVPGASRVAALRQPGIYGEATMRQMVQEIEDASRSLGIQVEILDARNPQEIEAAFFTITGERADALMELAGTLFYQERERISDLAAKRRLPIMFTTREGVVDGGLIAYGPSISDMFRRIADYVDKILKGAKPGDLPIEQPTKFELVVNLRTANALGITVPTSLLVRADEVIE
jgi:putative tryptophan/tyrosine transport system substrate-binding protein